MKKTEGTLKPHVRWWDRGYQRNSEPEVVVWETRHPEQEARLAVAFMERWGMIAGVEDGEDSAGRAKFRLATTEEVVSRACDMAAMAYEEFEIRGWFTQAPSLEEAKEMLKEKEDEDEEG